MNNITTLSATSLGGLTISKVSQRDPFLNFCIYGDSGIGKTILAGSASEVPAMCPVLCIDIEGGSESLRNKYPNVEVIRVKSWPKMQDVYGDLYDGHHPYKTVLIDSISEGQKFNMNTIMDNVVAKFPDRDRDVPSMREWGINLEQMRRFVRGFRDLEVNTIFTALNKNDQDERTGARLMKPKLTGQFINEFPALIDGIFYYYIKDFTVNGQTEYKRLLLTKKTENNVAKDRTDLLPIVIENPTMKIIYEYLTKEKH